MYWCLQIPVAFFLENGFFWYVCLLMIVSFDTIKCGRQIYFFNKRLLCCSREMWNPIFKKKKKEEAVIVEETFWNCYVNVAKKNFLTLSLYSTFSEYSYNKAQWSKDTARCKVVGMDTGGLGAKHRKCFFHGREYTVLLFWRETI